MKSDKILYFIILLVVGYAVYKTVMPDIEIVTEREIIQGNPDTLYRADTVFIDHVDSLFIADTVYIDSSGLHHARSSFEFEKDSVNVSGIVHYDQPEFSFSDIEIKSFHQTITRTDTILQTTTITETEPFYKNVWFWSSIAFLLALISTLFS